MLAELFAKNEFSEFTRNLRQDLEAVRSAMERERGRREATPRETEEKKSYIFVPKEATLLE